MGTEKLSESLSRLCLGDPLTRAERRFFARAHPAFFAYLYLRTDDGQRMVPSVIHWDWYDLFFRMLYGELRFVSLMAPKGHAKSTIFGKVIPLFLTCAVDANLRQIGGSVNSELAERFLRANRRELETNQQLIEDFGPFRPLIAEKWTQTELIVNRDSSSASPTWRAVGSQKPVMGGRSDWIIGDDVAGEENSMSALQRDKLDSWVDSDLLGTLEPTGRAIFVGTAKHNDDIYHRRERLAREKPESGWFFRRYDAIVDEQAHTTLWPERWSWDALMAKKAAIGTMAFNRDYRNIAINDETSLFPMALLDRAKRRDLTLVDSFKADAESIYAGIDLAIIEDERQAQLSDGDYTVCEVWARYPSGHRRLLWLERFRGRGFTPQVRAVESTLRRYQPLRLAIVEANQAQRWFASGVLEASRGDLPIQKHVTTRKLHADLFEAIPQLQALFEADMVELPYGDERSRNIVDVFVNELHNLGAEAHDDTASAFYMSEIAQRRLSSGLSWGKLSTIKD